MSVLAKVISSLCNFYQNPNDVFYRSTKIHPKINMESQGTPNSPNNFEKTQLRGLALSDFKTYYKAVVIQTHNVDQWTRIERNKSTYVVRRFLTRCQDHSMGKGQSFQ